MEKSSRGFYALLLGVFISLIFLLIGCRINNYYQKVIIYRLLIGLIFLVGLAFIPANIAERKGYNFGKWWIYGFLIWIVAFIHSLCLKDKNKTEREKKIAEADIALKYKELLDKGVITQQEFNVKMKEMHI